MCPTSTAKLASASVRSGLDRGGIWRTAWCSTFITSEPQVLSAVPKIRSPFFRSISKVEYPGCSDAATSPKPLEDGGNDVIGASCIPGNRLTRRFQPVGGLRLIDRGGVAHYLPLYLS